MTFISSSCRIRNYKSQTSFSDLVFQVLAAVSGTRCCHPGWGLTCLRCRRSTTQARPWCQTDEVTHSCDSMFVGSEKHQKDSGTEDHNLSVEHCEMVGHVVLPQPNPPYSYQVRCFFFLQNWSLRSNKLLKTFLGGLSFLHVPKLLYWTEIWRFRGLWSSAI